MFKVWKSTSSRLSLGLLRGEFQRDQIVLEIERAYQAGDLIAGQDRLLIIDDLSPPERIAVSDLAEIQQRVALLERTRGGGGSYKTVFVAQPSLTVVTLNIYAILWSLDPAFTPEFYQVQGLTTAQVILGCGSLKNEFLGRV